MKYYLFHANSGKGAGAVKPAPFEYTKASSGAECEDVPAGPDVVPAGPDAVREALGEHGYLADEGLATVVFLALALRRPLLLEGEAGVGKTEVAKVLARWRGVQLLRVQCYEGIDASQAVYEWDYARQLLHLRAAEAKAAAAGGTFSDEVEDEL